MLDPTSVRLHPLSRVAKLLKLLGPWGAARYLLARALGRESMVLRPRGFAHGLECRVKGSDVFVMWQVFGKDDCRVPEGIVPRVILDGGANVGYTAALYASRYPGAIVVAVEPDSANVAMLRRNTSRYANVRVIRAGLWKRDTHLTIENPTGQSWEFRVVESEAASGGSIEGLTIPTALARAGVTSAEVVKLDIEGSERELFAEGSLDWLRTCQFVVVETHGEAATDAVMKAVGTDFEMSRQGEKIALRRKAPG